MKKFLAILFAVLLTGCSQIDTGNVGVESTMGQVKKEIMPPGVYFSLFKKITEVSGKELALQLNDLKPQTSDKINLADLDWPAETLAPGSAPLDPKEQAIKPLVGFNALNGTIWERFGTRAVVDMPRLDVVHVAGPQGDRATEISEIGVVIAKQLCEQERVPFFFESWGAWRPDGGSVRHMVRTTADDPRNYQVEGEECRQLPGWLAPTRALRMG